MLVSCDEPGWLFCVGLLRGTYCCRSAYTLRAVWRVYPPSTSRASQSTTSTVRHRTKPISPCLPCIHTLAAAPVQVTKYDVISRRSSFDIVVGCVMEVLCVKVVCVWFACYLGQERELQMKARQAQAYEAMKGQFEGLLGRLQVRALSLVYMVRSVPCRFLQRYKGKVSSSLSLSVMCVF